MIPLCTTGVAVPCHAVPGRDVLCPRTFAPSAPLARELLSCPVSQPSTPTLRNPTSESLLTYHPHPTRFPSLSLLTFPYSPDALAILLLFPHRPSPILATFLSMACVLKRFSLTSPRKIGPTVRETGLFTHGRASLNFTIIPMCTPVSQCHVYAVPGSDVPCPCTTAPSAPPALELLSCPVS